MRDFDEDNKANMTDEEFNAYMLAKGDILIAILDRTFNELEGGFELIVSMMAERLTIDQLKSIYNSLGEFGREVMDYGEMLGELRETDKEDNEDESN